MTHGCTGQLWAGDHRLTERALAARGGVLSDGFALFPILEGVIEIKPRGEKQRTIRSLGWAFRTQIRTGKGQLFSALKSSGSGSLFMKSQG